MENETAKEPTPEEICSDIMANAVRNFTQNVDCLVASYPGATAAAESMLRDSWETLADFVESRGIADRKKGDPETIVPMRPFPLEHWHDYNRLSMGFDKSRRAPIVLSRSFLVSLISILDAFLEKVIRFIVFQIPESCHSENVTFEELRNLSTVNQAMSLVVTRFVADRLRESRSNQVIWIEKKIGTTLRGDRDLWQSIVELEQRRHLFVHCDGMVSEHYLAECRKHDVQLPLDVKLGTLLPITQKYFEQACGRLFEFGVKLSQVVWRQLLPGDRESDKSFLNLSYSRILQDDYDLAIRMLSFAIETDKFLFTSQDYELRNRLNLAQAHKWKGETARCREVLSKFDWTATKGIFRLAKACLEDNFDEALRLFREIGSASSDARPEYYRDWPIFRELRERGEFAHAFEEVFGSPLIDPAVINQASC